MSTSHIHLIRRGAVYYFRRRLPVVLAAQLRITHVGLSLRTKEGYLARRLARKLTVALDEVLPAFMTLKRPTEADLKRVLIALFNDILQRGELTRLAREQGEDPPWAFDGDDDPDTRLQKIALGPDHRAEELKIALQMSDYSEMQQVVEAMMRQRGLEPPGAMTPAYKSFLRKATATAQAAHAADARREEGEYAPAVHPFAHELGVYVVPTEQPNDQTLSEAYNQFFAARASERKLAKATVRQAEQAIALFTDLMGDPSWKYLTRQEAHKFREELAKLPALYGRSIYAKDTPSAAITRRAKLAAAARKGEAIEERLLAQITPKTVNKHIDFLGIFYEAKQLDEQIQSNPFYKVRYEKRHVKKSEDRRVLWGADHLTQLFSSSAWTGAVNPMFRAKAGSRVFEDHCFWVPLIGLFTGMREEEICALLVADIAFDNDAGCYVANVREGKTVNAKRGVPLHYELVKIGLIEYRDAVAKAGYKQLFPALDRRGPADKFHVAFSKWFTNYRKTSGLYEANRDFHSFRHTFNTAVERMLDNNTSAIRKIMGHAPSGEAAEKYFHGLRPVDTAPVIKRLDYGIDLSHLYLVNQPTRRILFEKYQASKAAKPA